MVGQREGEAVLLPQEDRFLGEGLLRRGAVTVMCIPAGGTVPSAQICMNALPKLSAKNQFSNRPFICLGRSSILPLTLQMCERSLSSGPRFVPRSAWNSLSRALAFAFITVQACIFAARQADLSLPLIYHHAATLEEAEGWRDFLRE